jgi:ATP phosphoribosyltransferase regulatory subunit
MIAMAVECMQAVGLPEFRLAVSQPEFIRQVLAESGLEAVDRERIQMALHKKDTSSLEAIVAACDLTSHDRNVLLHLPELCGKTEVFDTAANLIQSPAAQAALDNLVRVYEMLKIYGLEDRVLIDLSELRGFDYYTGIMFEGFTPNLGYQLCSGGRYDHLLSSYGPPDASTGFAINLEALLEALENVNPVPVRTGADCLLMDFRLDKRDALRISRELRRRGHRVARDIITRNQEGSLEYARQSGIPYGLVIGLDSLPSGQAILHDVRNGTEEYVSVYNVVDHVDAVLTRARPTQR